MNKDKISIIVPIYNVEKYLKRCVNSIINQTYKNLEIILVNDGSTDNCLTICENFKKKDKRIFIINKENGGLSDARNKGIEKATGLYVTFIDSDDYVEKDYVQFLYDTIVDESADISICSYQAVYENGKILKQKENLKETLNPHDTLGKMLYQNDINVASCAKLYKKDLFNNIKFPKGKIFEDAYTTYKLVDISKKIALNLEIKYNYMIRSNSILTSTFNENKLLLISAYEEMGNYVLKKYPDLKKAVVRANVYSRISTLRQMLYVKNRLRDKEKEYRRYIKSHTKDILKDNKTATRDKIACILISINLTIFKFAWLIYCKFTGRLYN